MALWQSHSMWPNTELHEINFCLNVVVIAKFIVCLKYIKIDQLCVVFFFFKEAARTNWEFYYLTVVVKFQNDVAKMQTTHIRCVQSWVSLLAEITRCWTTMTAILIPFWIQLIDIYSQLPNFIKRNIDSFSFQTIFAKAIYAFLNQLFV